MAEGQPGEGNTAETQALSTENAQSPIIFPSSVICFANATFPQGKAVLLFKFQFIVIGGRFPQLSSPRRFSVIFTLISSLLSPRLNR